MNTSQPKITKDNFNSMFIINFLLENLSISMGNTEAGATFDNSFFDNCFVFLRQLKNRSFLAPVFVHVTGQSKN